MNNDQTAIAAPAGMAKLATMTDEQVAVREVAIIRAAEAKKRLTIAAMTLAYPTDFHDFDGKPYLTGDGARRLCGVGINLSAPVFTVEKVGIHYFVECMIEAEWPAVGMKCVEIGTCDTSDKLWNNDEERCEINKLTERFGGDTALANRALKGWVVKKAGENATSRAVSAVMGIKGLKWEDLAAVGFTPDTAGAQIKYKGKKGAKKSTGAIETVDTAKLLSLADGSEVSVRAKILSAEITDKGAKYVVGDVSSKATLMSKNTDPLPEWCVTGATLFFPKVKVSGYQGRTYYWVNASPEEVDDGE